MIDAAGHAVARRRNAVAGRMVPVLRLARFRQLVGQDQRRQQQQPRLADRAELLGEAFDLAVDIARKLADAAFLAGVASDRVIAPIDGNRDLCHHASSARSRRPIAASRRDATLSVVASNAAYSALAAASATRPLFSPSSARPAALSSRATACSRRVTASSNLLMISAASSLASRHLTRAANAPSIAAHSCVRSSQL